VTVIRNVRLIPMTDEGVVEGRAVVVRDGRIARIVADEPGAWPDDATVIDGEGGFLLPGFIDTHVHYRPQAEFVNYLAYGVTTVLGLGQSTRDLEGIRSLQRDIAAGDAPGPRIYTTAETVANHIQLDSPQAARAFVQRLDKQGYDYAKVYNNISRDVFDAIVDEAAKHDLAVFGHIPRNFPVEHSLSGGLDVIAHAEEFYFTHFQGPRDQDLENFDGSQLPDLDRAQAVIDLMVEHEVALIPNLTFTFAQMKFWDDEDAMLAEAEAAFLHPDLLESWARTNSARRPQANKRILRERIKYGLICEFTRRAHEAGVLLTTGTDAPVPGVFPGRSLHSEMRQLVMAGLTYEQALSAATRNGGELVSRHVDREARIGQIVEGYEADLVLLSHNPLEDLRHTQSIEGVMTDGRWYPRAELDRLRAELAGKYARPPERSSRGRN
jgi:hypothetical protein